LQIIKKENCKPLEKAGRKAKGPKDILSMVASCHIRDFINISLATTFSRVGCFLKPETAIWFSSNLEVLITLQYQKAVVIEILLDERRKKMKKIGAILKDESGQGMVEYGLILGLVAVAAVAALLLLGPKISALFTTAEALIP
jgi:pilus assembly protein Flp/PilA